MIIVLRIHCMSTCSVLTSSIPLLTLYNIQDPGESSVIKDADFYRQKAKRRRTFYSKKQIMILQDGQERKEGDNVLHGVNYEGHQWVPPQTSITGEVVQMK